MILIEKIHNHFKFSWAKWLITILTIYHLPWLCKNYYVTRFSLHSKSKSMKVSEIQFMEYICTYLLKLGFLQTAQTKKKSARHATSPCISLPKLFFTSGCCNLLRNTSFIQKWLSKSTPCLCPHLAELLLWQLKNWPSITSMFWSI